MILSSFGANGNKKVEKTKNQKNDNFFFKNRKSLKNGAAAIASRAQPARVADGRWRMVSGGCHNRKLSLVI